MKRFLKKGKKRSHIFRIHGIFVVVFAMIVLFATGVIFKGNMTADVIAHSGTGCANGQACGFTWTDTFGWISLNCHNDWDSNRSIDRDEEECDGAGENYAVIVQNRDANRTLLFEISGFAWSPYLGRICFGTSCADFTPRGSGPGGDELVVRYDLSRTGNIGDRIDPLLLPAIIEVGDDMVEVYPVRGWARVIAHIDPDDQAEGGWISMGGIDPTMRMSIPNRNNGGVAAQLTRAEAGGSNTLTLVGAAWQQNSDVSGVGWVTFGEVATPSSIDPPDILDPPADFEALCTADSGLVNPYTCCYNLSDDDADAGNPRSPSFVSLESDLISNKVDCQDYDCNGYSFYDGEYDPPDISDSNYHCRRLPADLLLENDIIEPVGDVRENQFGDSTCFDNLDNDLDAWSYNVETGEYASNPNRNGFLPIDCEDPDCADAIDGRNRCVVDEQSPFEYNFCADGLDNDNDGTVDCADIDDCEDFSGCIAGCRVDVCATISNPARRVACDAIPNPDRDDILDIEYGGEGRVCDNCPFDPNNDQADINGNLVGDACDAFLQTEQGSIYSGGFDAVTAPTSAAPNATFCLLSSGEVLNFVSGTAVCPDERIEDQFELNVSRDSIVLWSEALRARFDISGLKDGKYGTVEQVRDGAELASELRNDSNTNSRVIYYNEESPLVVDEEILIPYNRGAVTIIVEGNLEFQDGSLVRYVPHPEAIADPRSVASVAWIVVDNPDTTEIVEGNINIAPEIGKSRDGLTDTTPDLVGAFFAANVISTGTFSPEFSTPDRALTIHGLIAARKFEFQREFAHPTRGAELIVYDGRVMFNPPPGLADFIKALPTFRNVAR